MSYELAFSVYKKLLNTTSSEISDELSSLKPYFKELRTSYLTEFGNNAVSVNYDQEKTRHAYLLTYVPKYLAQATLSYDLANLTMQDPNRTFRAAFFCCGPAPESASLLKYFQKSQVNCPICFLSYLQENGECSSCGTFSPFIPKKFELHFIDINPKWQQIREALISELNVNSLKTYNYEIDLTEPDAIQDISIRLTNLDLITFQNCLNEISTGDGLNNLLATQSLLNSGAQMLISDLTFQRGNTERLMNISDQLRREPGIVSQIQKDIARCEEPPEILRQFLFGTFSERLVASTNSNFSLLTYKRS